MLGRRRKKPSLLEIDDMLRKELEPHFADLERLRKGVFFRGLGAGVAIGAALAMLAWILPIRSVNNIPIEILPVGAIAGIAFFTLRARQRYRAHFKEHIMRPLARRFFPNLTYHPDLFVSNELYQMAGLFRRELDSYTGNDYFSGKLGEVDFQFSELHCTYITKAGKRRTTHTAFRGFFFVGDFHRDFYFRTTIQPDIAEQWLGVLGRGLQRVGSGSRLVDLEDPEFEKLFVVTSDDQVEARYILTPTFMEKLKEFRGRVKNDIHLAFVNGRMILAIPSGRDYFEPRLFGEILNRRDLMQFIDMLSLLIGVAEEFLHHPRFGSQPPAMPHPPLPPKAVPPPLTALQKAMLKKA